MAKYSLLMVKHYNKITTFLLPKIIYTFFELITFEMAFRDRIVVCEIDVRALLFGRRPF
jgi:hypothetical protein